jgi:hypothetical protein
MIEKKPFLVDVAVLLLFFARPEQTEKVFEQIKLARPKRLYLYQDGAREGRLDDVENINKCREIVENIDWDCEVHKWYQEKNIGCDPSEFLSQKWMFETEEMGIVLEDDDVPSQSFFPYCKELLEKYKDDDRIHMICGLNLADEYQNSSADYFFSKECSIWGWASWRRVLDTWDEHYTWLDDSEAVRMVLDTYPTKKEKKSIFNSATRHRASGKAYYESIHSSSMVLNGRLAIIPTKNMISNIGVGINTTHSVNNINKLSNATKRVLFKKTFELKFPLKHPKYVIEDKKYKKEVDEILSHTFCRSVLTRSESIIRQLIFAEKGDYKVLWNKLLKKIGIKR